MSQELWEVIANSVCHGRKNCADAVIGIPLHSANVAFVISSVRCFYHLLRLCHWKDLQFALVVSIAALSNHLPLPVAVLALLVNVFLCHG